MVCTLHVSMTIAKVFHVAELRNTFWIINAGIIKLFRVTNKNNGAFQSRTEMIIRSNEY